MDGITNNAYRSICKQIRDNPKNEFNTMYDFYRFTEFMSVEGYARNPNKLVRHLLTSQDSSNTIAQIYGSSHENLLYTALDIDQKYADSFSGIELNIGCPSPKIMSCEAGAGMLRCRPKTLQIIKKISEGINKPFSIKTRRGLTDDDRQEQFDFIIESAYYCDMITIHGRSYKQSHSGAVDRNFILDVKQELLKRNLGHVTIIGNGGLKSASEGLVYLNMLTKANGGKQELTPYGRHCEELGIKLNGDEANQDPTASNSNTQNNQCSIDGIMLGQAAMTNPRSLTNYTPDIQELYDITLQHLHLNLANEYYFATSQNFDNRTNILKQPTDLELDEIATGIENGELTHLGEKRFSLVEFRKHLFWYVNGLENNNEFKRQVSQISDYKQLLEYIHLFFGNILSGNNSGTPNLV